MRIGVCILGLWVATGAAACTRKPPADKPPSDNGVLVEDLLPLGTDVCFPSGMTNASTEVGSASDPAATSQPLSVEVGALMTPSPDAASQPRTRLTPPGVRAVPR